MADGFTVTISDLRPTIRTVEAEVGSLVSRGTAGLLEVATRIQKRARSNMATHHYEGRAESAITVWTGVAPSGSVRVHVGIRGNTFAPEGRTFEVGWRSARGLRPPTAPLALWAFRKGLAETPAQARHLGFVLARAMGERPGYTFGEFHWLSDAADAERGGAVASVAKFMATGLGAQPRLNGRFLPFGEPIA